MSNWDADYDDDYDFESYPPKRKNSIIRTPEQRAQKTWNGNPVKTMESDHVMNAILFCEKKFADAMNNHRICHGGDEDFYFESVFDMFPEYINLRDEWKLRMEKK